MSERTISSPARLVSPMTELPSWALLAIMYSASAVAWPRAAQRIAVHWNIHGQIDGYGGRVTGLLVLPLVATGLCLLFRWLPRIDPGRTNYPSFARAHDVLRTAALAFMAALHLLILAPVFGHRVRMTSAIPALVGALLVVIGAVMGKVRPNWFFGIRTPWTLSSKTAWIRTHRLGGWLFVAAGALALVTAAAVPRVALVATVASALGAALVAVIYSYVVWRHADDRLPPAGTSPAD